MKKKIIIWTLVIVGVITAFCLIKYFSGQWITYSQVEKATLRGYYSCDGPRPGEVELSKGEIWQLVAYYNLAIYDGRVTAQDCCSDFGFVIYMEDGTIISGRDADFPRIEVHPPEGESYWINSSLLASYAKSLVKKYDLDAE